MEDVSKLLERVRNEITTSKQKLKRQQQEQVEQHQNRKKRLELLEGVFENLRNIWRPRLEAFAKEFGDQVEVRPSVKPGNRQAVLSFKSPLASIKLRFTAMTEPDVRNLILAYDVDILPILMRFENHSEISFPINQVDTDAVRQWLDDRMVSFVKTYLAMHENPYYLKDHMAHDPIADVTFPSFAAAATRERSGQTIYFISEETAAEYDKSTK